MKNNKYLLSFFCTFLYSLIIQGATFTSTQSGNWNVGTTWGGACAVGCVAGVDYPSSSDNAVISAGHTVTQNITTEVHDITIHATGTLTTSFNLYSRGNYTNNGTHNGTGTIFFTGGHGWTISGTGSFSNTGNWDFYVNRTIAGTVTRSSGYIIVENGATLTISGTLTANTLFNLFGTGTIVNTGTFNINSTPPTSLTASAIGNTVNYGQTGGTQTVRVPATSYYNLSFTGASVKQFAGSVDIDNNFTVTYSSSVNVSNFNLTIGGNWTNAHGANLQNLATVTFDGSGTQTILRTLGETEVFNHVTIGGTGTVQLGTGIRVTGNLTISSGTFDVTAPSYAIAAAGNWTHNGGTFTPRAGMVTFNGSAAQTVGGTSSTTFFNITSSNTNASGVSVTGSITISRFLRVTSRSFNTSGAGTITFPATTATNAAKIETICATCSLGGTGWIIQAFIDGPATAYWQYLSTPLSGLTVGKWDEDAGFYMSGVGGDDGTACCPTFYSVKTYTEATGAYTDITSIATALTTAKGYLVWMGDDLTSLSSDLIFDSDDFTPHYGNKSIAVTTGGAGGGYNLVGNPYACPIDFSTVRAASSNIVGATFYVLNEAGGYDANPNGGVIAAHQGFLVVASSGGNLNFTEACKNTSAAPDIQRTSDPANRVQIAVSSTINGLGGQAYLNFDEQAASLFERETDHSFLASPYETAANIWTQSSDQHDLMYNSLPENEESLSIPLLVKPAVYGQHTLSFKNLNRLNAYNCAYLEDPATGKQVNLKDQSIYSFTAENINAEKQFLLHFSKDATCGETAINALSSLESAVRVVSYTDGIRAIFSFEEESEIKISVFNTMGQEIMPAMNRTIVNESVGLVNPSSHGVYLVRVQKGDQVITRKIMF